MKLRRLRRKLPAWLEVVLITMAIVVFLVLGATVLWATLTPIPAINNFENRQVAQSTKIYDRTGNIVLYDVHGSVRRTYVPLDQISAYVQKATVATEDDSFYTNAGFRPLAFLRAMWIDFTTHSYAQGGSTITQQVVKNALLSQDKTLTRKIEEIILALRLTATYSKDDILSTYLNETSYGGTVYGVEEAAQYFFGVDAKDLDLAQSAYLAALPQAPTYFSPYGDHKAALDTRKNFVLSRMRDLGFITSDEYAQAIAEQVQFKPPGDSGIKAPHFVFYIREYLEQKYGADEVSNGGLHVITTLDYDLQQQAEATVSKWAPQMQQNFNASNEGMVAIDPKTGQILAMVGSKDYFDNSIDGQVNTAVALRQPGSSFKPFVYATAFEKGYTPDTILYDVPTQFSTFCSPSDVTNDTPPCYAPSNFDDTFKGPMTMRNALAQSENIPAIKTLYLAGITDSLSTAQSLGISTLGDKNQYGLTLVLGGGEVTLLDMTSAYSVFANDGTRNPATGILQVTDASGKVLESFQPQAQQVLDPQIARQISDILSDNTARTPEFGADSPLYFKDYDVADKTGTTNDYHDVWILGYSPSIAVGAWAGNNDNSPMAKKIAAFIIAPMWHDFMEQALEKYSSPSDSFTPPSPDPAYSSLPPVLTGNPNTNPSLGIHSILYWVNKNDPRSGRPSNPAADPQFSYWDYAVQEWSGQHPSLTGGTTLTTQNLVPQPLTTPQPQPGLRVVSPLSGAVVPVGTKILLKAIGTSIEPITNVSFYANGTFLGTASSPFELPYQPTSHGTVIIRAVGIHPNGTTTSDDTTITVQ